MKNCNECKFVSITEEDQNDKRIDHLCTKYSVRVFHRSNIPKMYHEYIRPCPKCEGKNFIKR